MSYGLKALTAYEFHDAIPLVFANLSLATYPTGHPAQHEVLARLEDWRSQCDDWEHNGLLLLHGPMGTGKSVLAMTLADDMLMQGEVNTAVRTRAQKPLADLYDGVKSVERVVLDVHVLVLDDADQCTLRPWPTPEADLLLVHVLKERAAGRVAHDPDYLPGAGGRRLAQRAQHARVPAR